MIPVCEPLLGDKELEYAADCLRTNWISSAGKYIARFEQGFAEYCGCRHGIATTSGTTALHLALAALKIGKGDEVILPSFTMAACVFSVIYTGAKPVLVDSEPETWNMDVAQIEKKITAKTKAIMPVHIYGHPCDMAALGALARQQGLHLLEGRMMPGLGHRLLGLGVIQLLTCGGPLLMELLDPSQIRLGLPGLGLGRLDLCPSPL